MTMGKVRIVMMGALLTAALMMLACASMRTTDEWRDNFKTLQGHPSMGRVTRDK